jgi:enoyl-CoA hydratase/carnithine racemase
MSPEASSLVVDDCDGIRIIRLHRPHRHNALDRAAVREICEVLDESDADDAVKAVVFTGSGRVFSVGADLSGGGSTFGRTASKGSRAELDVAARDNRDFGGILSLRLFASTKPLFAAINGDAVGLGVTMTLPMDVRVATPDARFGFVFARRGIVPEACSTWFLPRVVGISTALEWTMSGRLIGADEARHAGLVQDLLPQESLIEGVVERAQQLVEASAPVSIAATRQLLWHGLTQSHPMEAHRVESHLIRVLGAGPDAGEGIEAFLEKRPARFGVVTSSGLEPFRHWWSQPEFEANDG